jgi:CBS domain-containing membrane protein
MKRRLLAGWLSPGMHPFRASLGAALAIAGVAAISSALMGGDSALPFLVASMGASAVLIFAVPASPLSQPWAVIGGNVVSALAGVTAARLAANPLTAMALGVALSIIAMHLCRCLHAPGGGVALIAAMGGPAVKASGFAFALVPVGLNAALLVIAALIFNNLAGSRYPHRPQHVVPRSQPPIPRSAIEAVLEELEDRPDISIGDLEEIIRAVEARIHPAR